MICNIATSTKQPKVIRTLRLKVIFIFFPLIKSTPSPIKYMATAYAKKPKHPNKNALTERPIAENNVSRVIRQIRHSVEKSTVTTPKVSLVNSKLFSFLLFVVLLKITPLLLSYVNYTKFHAILQCFKQKFLNINI